MSTSACNSDVVNIVNNLSISYTTNALSKHPQIFKIYNICIETLYNFNADSFRAGPAKSIIFAMRVVWAVLS